MAPIGKLAATLLAWASLAQARVLSAQAGVDQNQVKVGELVTVTVQASVDSAHGTPWPELQLADGLKIHSKDSSSSTSRSITIINGRRRDENLTNVAFRFRLSAQKPGTFPISISLAGQNLGHGQIVAVDAPQDVRTATLVPKGSVYVGQQIPFTWRLSADRPFDVPHFPDIRQSMGNGFYSESRDSQQLQLKPATENGKQVLRLDITGNLFPLRPGSQKLPGTALDYQIVERSPGMDPFEAMARGMDPFDAMRGRTRVLNGTAKTEEIHLEILPVPERNRPGTFQGGVGEFRLETKLEKSELKAGTGTTLTFTLEGNGQPQASGVPVWSPPSSVEAYPPQDEWIRSWKNGVLWTTLVRKIVLVPRQAGPVALDSVRFSWWDPSAKEYRTSAKPLGSLQVEAAPESRDSTVANTRQGGPSLTGWDRFWIGFGKFSALLWSLIFLAALGWLSSLWLARRRSEDYRRTKALVLLERSLDRMRPDLPPRRLASELRRILLKGASLCLGEEALACTSQELGRMLCQRLAWSEAAGEDATELSEALQASEFAGIPLDPKSKARVQAFLGRLKPRRK